MSAPVPHPVAACDKRILSQPSESPASLSHLVSEARRFAQEARAENTARAYRSDWRRFSRWCDRQAALSLPARPEVVALYLTAHAFTHRVSSLERWLVPIGQAHRAAGHEDPTKTLVVRSVWRGIRRARGVACEGKAPVLVADLRRMVAGLTLRLRDLRDRALVLVGFAGAFRRSELVSLDNENLQFTAAGVVIVLARSKIDQDGEGRKVGVPYGANPATCPVRAVQTWLEASGIVGGPVFRPVTRSDRVLPGRLSGFSVARVVKRLVAVAGLDPARFAGHSLRAGLATSAAVAGVDEREIMRQTGHRSVSVFRRYVRDGNLFRNNAAAAVGL